METESRPRDRISRSLDALLTLWPYFVLMIVAIGGLHSYTRHRPIYKNLSDGFSVFFGLVFVRMALARTWDPMDVPVLARCVRAFDRVTRWSNAQLTGGLVIYATILFIAASVHHRLVGTGVDLSLHLNYLHNANAGNGFITYLEPTSDHILHNHLYLVEYLIWPLYKLFPTPDLVFFLQSFALVAGAIAVYKLAQIALSERWQHLLCAILYLIYPRLRDVNLYDFHPDAFSVPMLLFALLAFYRNRPLLVTVLAVLACGIKESVCLSVGFFGIYLLFQKRWERRRWIPIGMLLTAVGLGGFWVYRAVFVKALTQGDGQISYYRWLGTDLHGVLSSVFLHPQTFIATIATKARFSYVIGIFAPLAFLSLLAPTSLFMTIPTWGYLMAREPFLFNIHEHHPCDLMPFMFVAFIFGYRRLLQRTNAGLVTLILIAFSLGSYGSPETSVIHSYFYKKASVAKLRAYIAGIPKYYAVAAHWDNYLPHIADRRYAFKWYEISGLERPVNVVLVNDKQPQGAAEMEKLTRQGYREVFQDGPHHAYETDTPTPIDQILQQLGWPERKPHPRLP